MSARAVEKPLNIFVEKLEELRETVPAALEDDFEELVGQAELLKGCLSTFLDEMEAESSEEGDDVDDEDDDDGIEDDEDEEDEDDEDDEEEEDEDL